MKCSPFRSWLKEQIKKSGKTIIEFSEDSGLSRQVCNSHSRKFDPCLESIVLCCETLAIWNDRNFEDVVIEGLRHTVHFNNSKVRTGLTRRMNKAKVTGCEERAQLASLAKSTKQQH